MKRKHEVPSPDDLIAVFEPEKLLKKEPSHLLENDQAWYDDDDPKYNESEDEVTKFLLSLEDKPDAKKTKHEI
jgi:hypothetical protein